MRVFVPVLIAVLLLGWPAPVHAAPEGKIAVVDVLDLLDTHPDTVKLRQWLQSEEVAARELMKQSRERLDKLRDEILALSEGPERERKQEQYDKQAWISEYDFKSKLREAQRKYVRELERIYAGVVALIRSYARTNGIGVVVQMTDDDIGAVDHNDYVMKVALRTVVYFEPTLNITDEVRAMFPKPDPPK